MTTPAPLSALLRDRTRQVHEAAEGSPFVTSLLAGRLPQRAYAALAAQHLMIYGALEGTGVARGALPVDHAGLARLPGLHHDLAGLLGAEWRSQAVALAVPATVQYTERLGEVAGTPEGFVAHHYVRYLGDLSGGQVVARAVTTAYGPGTPVEFYRFDGLAALRRSYRAALDAAPLDPTAVTDEAVLAFELNRAVFADLADVYC